MVFIIPVVLILMAGFIFWWIVKVNKPNSGEIKVNQAKDVYEILSSSSKKDRESSNSHEYPRVQEVSRLEPDQPLTIDGLPESGQKSEEKSQDTGEPVESEKPVIPDEITNESITGSEIEPDVPDLPEIQREPAEKIPAEALPSIDEIPEAASVKPKRKYTKRVKPAEKSSEDKKEENTEK